MNEVDPPRAGEERVSTGIAGLVAALLTKSLWASL